MTQQHGRTWPDVLAENVWLLRCLLVVFVLILVVLTISIFTGHDITKDGIIKSKDNSVILNDTMKRVEQVAPKQNAEINREPAKNFIRYKEKPVTQKETIQIEKPIIHVTSTGQSGGITANQVNIGKPIPPLLDNMKRSILEAFPDINEEIGILYLAGPTNSMEYAYKLKEFMENAGYKRIGFGMVMSKPEPKGVTYNRNNGRTSIIVGIIE